MNEEKTIEDTKTLVATNPAAAALAATVEKPLVSDEKIVGLFDETLAEIDKDRVQAEERYLQISDFVVNSGDSSSASKEAMVNLLKIKNETLNQKIKVLDLWTRLKMKDRVTSSQVYAYQQNNKFETASTPSNQIKNLIKMATEIDKNPDGE